jgi:hypothetical protein
MNRGKKKEKKGKGILTGVFIKIGGKNKQS